MTIKREAVEQMCDDLHDPHIVFPQSQTHPAATMLRALLAERDALRESLKFYANPEIYKPHPHGPHFDRRDLSYHAIAALEIKGEQQ